MKAKFSGYREKVLKAFHDQSIVHTLGIEILEFGEGWFHTRLLPNEKILQHHGYVHAGAIATMADLSSGFASYSLMAEEDDVLTVEFKINLLRPAVGDLILCHQRPGKPSRAAITRQQFAPNMKAPRYFWEQKLRASLHNIYYRNMKGGVITVVLTPPFIRR